MKKQLGKAIRGLTFSLDSLSIGAKFRYFIDKKEKCVVITMDENGTHTVSRKRSGKQFKPLIDLRGKDVKELVSQADYMEVEVKADCICVYTYKIRKNIQVFRPSFMQSDSIYLLSDIVGEQTGEIRLQKVSGIPGQLSLFSDFGLSERATQEMQQSMLHVFDTISLFSGAGLLDYAFRDPQIRFVKAVDFDKDACETYRKNIGDHIQCADIRVLEADTFPDCELVIGGPCCQGYSNANRIDITKDSAKAKRLLIDDYIRIVAEKHPKVFVIENVPQFLTKEQGLYFQKVLDGLLDYEITASVIEDHMVGGYTRRKRAIVIGSRIGKIELPSKNIGIVRTVKDALQKVTPDWINFRDVTTPRPESIRKMQHIPQGGNWQSLPPELNTYGPKTHSNVLRRLSWNEVSPTITNWRKCQLLHPKENRILTVSEAAALMGLNKDFPIYGSSLNSRQQQVGNGVTQAIGKFVKKYVLLALNRSVPCLV